MNVGLKIAKGDFIHIWCNDLVIYPDYLNKLNQYILNYGDNNLYAGHFIATDVRHAASRENSNNFYFDSFDKPEGFHVYHKRYLEFFNEEYEGYATHWSQEHCYRLWKKIKFICMQDNYVVHLPHYARLSEHDALNSSYKSSLIFEKIKHEI